MNRSLISLVALAAAGAHAQSTVTLTGQVDAAITTLSTTNSGSTVRKTGLYNAGMGSSYLAFKGREDLGGGLYGGFHLEAGLNTDTGAGTATNSNNQRSGASPALAGGQGLTFNRFAYVALGSTSLGEVRLGRVYTAAFWNHTYFDSFSTNGVGSSLTMTQFLGLRNVQSSINVSNAIEYATPGYIHAVGGRGFYAHATAALGENPSNGSLAASNPSGGGNHAALRVGYATGPYHVSYSAAKTRNTAGVSGTGNNAGDYLIGNLAGSYDFGMVKVQGQYVTEKLDGASAATGFTTGVASNQAKSRSAMLGAIVPVGAGKIKASYIAATVSDNIGSPEKKGKLFAIGYDYSFSKRTTAYVTYARIANNAAGNFGFGAAYVTPSAGQSSSGLAVGVKHFF